LRQLLNWIKKEYNYVSVFVTQNGFPDNGEIQDTGRIMYLVVSSIIYRMIQKDGLKEPVPVVGGMARTVKGISTHARQLVALFQVLCSLYGLTCVGYAQSSLEFVSRSPLIHVVSRSFCLYTDSLFAQIGDSNDKCSCSLVVEC